MRASTSTQAPRHSRRFSLGAVGLPLDEPPRDEHGVRGGVQAREEPADALLGDARVLVVAEHLLQRRRGRQQPFHGLAGRGVTQRRRDELARVAHPLPPDAQRVQHLVGRVVACPLDRAPELARLRPDEVDERGLGARRPGPGVGSGARTVSASRSSSAEVPGGGERLEHGRAGRVRSRSSAPSSTPPASCSASGRLAISRCSRSSSTSRSRTGPSAPPSQPSSARRSSAQCGVQQRPGGLQRGPHPPHGDPHLVEVLDVLAGAGAGLVREQRPQPLVERRADVVDGCRGGVDGHRLGQPKRGMLGRRTRRPTLPGWGAQLACSAAFSATPAPVRASTSHRARHRVAAEQHPVLPGQRAGGDDACRPAA